MSRPSFASFARKHLGTSRYPDAERLRALAQLDALDHAWDRNERERGSVSDLVRLQYEYCELTGAPLRWADERMAA